MSQKARIRRFALVATFITGCLAASGQQGAGGGRSNPAQAPGKGDMVLSGQTEPASRREVPAAMRGILAEVNVKEGQAVTKGQVLAKLDDLVQREKVAIERVSAESGAEIEFNTNKVEFAKRELDQIKAIMKSGVELQQKELAVLQAILEVQVAKEKQSQSKARLNLERAIHEQMTIRSPINGSILRINKQEGEETDEKPLMIIVDTSRLNAVFYLPRALFGKVKSGDKVMLDLEGEKRQAIVTTVDPIIDQASQIFRVKLEIDNADGKLAAGITANWTWTGK